MLRILLILFTVILFPVTSFAADWNNYWVSGWHDENSNYNIYNLWPGNEKVKDQTVIMHNPDQDEWVRLEEKFWSLHGPYKQYDVKLPAAWIREKGERFNPYKNYYYDIVSNRLTLGKQYQISPDEKWGLQYNDFYGSEGRVKSYLLKNMGNGTIEECLELKNTTGFQFYWLPDSSILFCRYSQEEKQNVIYTLYPETKEFNKIIPGTLYAYDGEALQILFVKNEPKRETWVLDLSTGLEKREMNPERFYSSSGDTPKVPLPPEDLSIESLKVLTPEETIQYEHEIEIGDQVIPVPYIFNRKNTEFIPLRPLMEPLGIKININQTDRFVREYQVSYQEKKFTLSEGEYINYKWQLFVTPEVLKKMGLSEFTFKPINAVPFPAKLNSAQVEKIEFSSGDDLYFTLLNDKEEDRVKVDQLVSLYNESIPHLVQEKYHSDPVKLGFAAKARLILNNGNTIYLNMGDGGVFNRQKTADEYYYLKDEGLHQKMADLINDLAKPATIEEWELISLADVNLDNQEEAIYLDKAQIKEGLVILRIIDAAGVQLWSEQFSTSHAGWGQMFLCELDDKQYLLRYNPTMYQGYCTYDYTLFTLENDQEKVFRTNTLEFDINGTKELDAPKMIAFADEVNKLLGKSTLLISSNGDFSFGSSTAEMFFEKFSWLDGGEYQKLFEDGDSLEVKLNKFSNYAVSNRKLMEQNRE